MSLYPERERSPLDAPAGASSGAPATLWSYLRLARRRWLFLSIGSVVGASLAFGWSIRQEPVYQAQAEVFVSVVGEGSAGDLAQGSTFTERRVTSYGDLVSTSRVLESVAKDLDISLAEVRAAVTATTPQGSVLVVIAAKHHGAGRAAAIANATADSLVKTVNAIERPDGKGKSQLRLTVVQKAEQPQAPVSPKPVRDAALGFGFGLVVGLLAAVARERLNTRVRGEEDIAHITTLPILGRTQQAKSDSGEVLLSLEGESFSARAESYRQLRTNLLFTSPDERVRSLTVTSSIPGEGKSTTAINLAMVCAQGGSRVLLVDADLRRPRVAHYLGLEDAVGLTTVLAGRVEVADAIQPWGADGHLSIMASGLIPPNPSELLASESMRCLIAVLEREFDLVIFDAPPLVPVTDPAVLGSETSAVCLVVGLDESPRYSQLRGALAALQSVGARTVGLTVNGGKKGLDAQAYYDYSSRSERRSAGAKPSRLKRGGHRGRGKAARQGA
ncbi:polysaccharide biosynthesis tyrosine autokinase [Streptomyces sp. TRM66268-LWL]|uniref:non-specific protein-tyrosine kinase n=1 Tax=Streptomyces polyasparticus TaxID=2767826 RepID=A0ABR7SVK2_9ACTN|nr:polysaccharide biosynthesis tyrosine autokinase [Streptomyces polyasparticus]MBC9719525.1 polysaccharide biosynthesis tyrosine autokinase [Streptomyces polyasparticus]